MGTPEKASTQPMWGQKGAEASVPRPIPVANDPNREKERKTKKTRRREWGQWRRGILQDTYSG